MGTYQPGSASGVDPAAPPRPSVARREWAEACAELKCRPRTATETVSIADAVGRIAAEPVLARTPAPAFEASAVDGVALRAVDTAAARPDYPVYLERCRFVVVDTGDPVPSPYDTVVAGEFVELTADGSAVLRMSAPARHHVRLVGEDVEAGEVLFPAGHRMRPVDGACAAATGTFVVEVHARPRVTIVPTGDELRPLGEPLRGGQVPETNSLLLAGRARELGCDVAIAPIVPDCPDQLAEALTAAAADSDLVVLIAGGGAGRDDYTARVLASCGALVVHGAAVRPGHPVTLAVLDEPRVPVLGVPGYPVAAALSFDLFATPVLASLTGSSNLARPRLTARLACEIKSPSTVEEWIRVRLENHDGEWVATPLRRGAGALSSLMRADGLLEIGAGTGELARGLRVEVELLRGLGAAG
ncbi:MAG: molybdopterin molybdotransferase MoeA [Sporichthyaceae bacterium]